ncbi:MAG: CotH kinase family protein [Bacteroidales bacterium]|nr:CotH kinase family protein [Bacteroidales bacterium]
MKKVLKYLVPLALMILGACSGREDIIRHEDPSNPVLRLIEPSALSIVVPPDESTRLPFTVKDAAFKFSQISLKLTDGSTPEEFRLSEVIPGDTEGSYIAVIEDCGLGEQFDLYARLAISTGSNSFVQSPPIRIMSGKDPEGTVKTGLPVVFVTTENGAKITSKTEFVKASFSVKGTRTLPGMDAVSCRIRGRGNTTWTWPKKPYLVALDERASVLGMPKHKRWVLLANFMDRTLMRNLVSMKVSSLMTHLAWTPRCVPVELVLNGKHVGSYLLIEQVRVDKNRVDIDEDQGLLYELDFHYDNPIQWKDHNIPFSIKYPDEDDITQERISYAKKYISEVANTIYGSNFKDPVNGYAKYLDVDSYIDYWIVYEVMTNHELGNPGSVMFHKDPNGKLTAGPCWDFDWGVLSFYTCNGANALVNGHAIWYDRLFQDPDFKARVRARFLELKPQLQEIPNYMEECRTLLSESAKLNFEMWNPADDRSQNGGKIINGDEELTFDAAVDRLKKNFNTHLKVIESKL